jgi:hypothetical protein
VLIESSFPGKLLEQHELLILGLAIASKHFGQTVLHPTRFASLGAAQ